MAVAKDYLIFELISCSLRLTFLKICALPFSQSRSTQCLRDFWGFLCILWSFTESFSLATVVLGRVEVCALLDLGRYESASPWMKTLGKPMGCSYSSCYCILHLLFSVPYVFGQ